ncbi:uncharacterized protein LOC129920073 isoform X2 [Episyrphus balteatus]|uniref:uncharacterized protein LOC129905174 isoform X2 n=2 Tax=Episyrphus balteatus TaxID=286459 RepID=UPI0024864CE5|nr:uncharacterized protein LOC129905174 isoform X2 [Episyrphus balteatus]XP_055838583.1 uncharacterized protein LOC129906710 isoform X2 [Episyrphus balteatus]XP_055839773.1 uncharacterized protein LOC129907523 isoform X2 [Episyrphus balteatus]XP_055841933.1 uncharacterized protein LOC129909024 isoform X2 [Episyrphus balteatus]XP_055843457.1 uncharacterized protein LOC129910205 isoform X2 [Episyrphus balteatus]XP_055845983.1 uncharacterized protein LOC129911963 isoform X2 [Episyrphus balteatus]
MYCVVETLEDEGKFVTAVPKNWVIDGTKLLWPKSKKDSICGRKNCITASDDWQSIACKLIFDDIGSWEEAVQKEKDAEYLSSSEENTEEVTIDTNSSEYMTDMNKLMSTLIPNSDVSSFTPPNEDVTITNVISDLYTFEGPSTSTQFKELSSKIDEILERQRSTEVKVQAMQGMLEAFMAKSEVSVNLLASKIAKENAEEVDEELQLDEIFPLTSVQQIEEIEEKLHQNAAFKKKLVRKLSSYGGANGMKTIRTICKCIFTDPLLAEHSWLGTNAKKSFSQYKFLYKTILEAVRSRYPTYSEAEGASFFKGFLKQAPFRMGKPSTNTSSNTSSSASDGQSTT